MRSAFWGSTMYLEAVNGCLRQLLDRDLDCREVYREAWEAFPVIDGRHVTSNTFTPVRLRDDGLFEISHDL